MLDRVVKPVGIFVCSVLLASCGPQTAQTPEPDATVEVDRLVKALGVQRSWNSQTLEPNPTPDGIVLMQWMERRKATLGHTLGLHQAPATANPGRISATLEWELETQRKERPFAARLAHYHLDFETVRYSCPRTAEAEWRWFAQYRAEHARGQHPQVLDWGESAQQFKTRCAEERRTLPAEAHAGEAAAGVEQARQNVVYAAQQAEFDRGQQDELQRQRSNEARQDVRRNSIRRCEEPYQRAWAEYNAAPSPNTGAAVSAAASVKNACLDEVERRLGPR